MLNRNSSKLVLLLGIILFITFAGRECTGRSGKAKTGSSTTEWAGIAAPSGLATTGRYYQIDLSWQDNSNNEDAFRIERAIGLGGNWQEIGSTTMNVTTYSDTNNLAQGVTYYYRVRGYMTTGDFSNYSNEASGNSLVIIFTKLGAGASFSFALSNNGLLWAWGLNQGTLGLGDDVDRIIPTQVGTNTDWSIVLGGSLHSLGLKVDRTLWVWGSNDYGQLGTGSTLYDELEPFLLTGTNWSQIGGGYGHTVALESNGKIWAWGDNGSGQLGIGDFIDRYSPQLLDTASDWSKIAVGVYHTLAIKNNRTLWGWGNNMYYQLGLTGFVNRNTPTQLSTDSDWDKINCRAPTNFAIKTNRTLWAWGSEADDASGGSLGLGDSYMYNAADITQIGVDSDWLEVEAGGYHTLALKTNGTMWIWGSNEVGQLGLGLGESEIRTTPCQIGTDSDWSIIKTGFFHSMALRTNSSFWAWGYNSFGQLGYGDTIDRNLVTRLGTPPPPTPLTATTIESTKIRLNWVDNSTNEDGFIIERRVTTTGYAVFATVNSGSASYSDEGLITGNTYYYRMKAFNSLGDSAYSNEASATATITAPTNLTLVNADSTGIRLNWIDTSNEETEYKIERSPITNTNYVQIATIVANATSYLNTGLSFGTLYYYRVRGSNPSGNGLYSNEASLTATVPAPVNLYVNVYSETRFDIGWTDVSSDELYFKIERKDGASGTWTQINTVSANVTTYSDGTVSALMTYYYRVRAYSSSGDGPYSGIASGAAGGAWSVISAGSAHNIGLKADGTIWSWGDNTSGQMGIGYTSDGQTTMVQTGTDTDWSRISAGTFGTMALKTNPAGGGTLWAWGGSATGFLGELGDRFTPTQIGTNSDWVSVSCGSTHSVYRKTDGTIWTLGFGENGQLGLGSGNNGVLVPTQIGTSSDWSLITTNADSQHTVALKNNGALWAWGSNNFGQLGDPNIDDITEVSIPNQIGTALDWSAVSLGSAWTVALKTNKTIWVWGDNSVGELGLGDTINRLTPTQLNSEINWAAIAAGGGHVIARKNNGTLWVWGGNSAGALGLGNTVDRNIPTVLGTASDWSLITAGTQHTIARKNTGTIWAWGGNGYGQLGVGDVNNRLTPTQIPD
jgi:alpha-tubulin suppressor-like RCC1 family protein